MSGKQFGTMVLSAVLAFATRAAVGAVLFYDDFESDTAASLPDSGDLDPVIGAGDIGGSWVLSESNPTLIQVADNPPGAGPNQALKMDGYAAFATWDDTPTKHGTVQASFLQHYVSGSAAAGLGGWKGAPGEGTGNALKIFELAFKPDGSVQNRVGSVYSTVPGLSHTPDAWEQVTITLDLTQPTMLVEVGSTSATVPRFDAGLHDEFGTLDYGNWSSSQRTYLDEVSCSVAPYVTCNPDATWPTAPKVEVINDTQDNAAAWGIQSNLNVTQTFKVDREFTVGRIYLEYNLAADLTDTFDIKVFEVDDVNAPTLTEGNLVQTLTGLNTVGWDTSTTEHVVEFELAPVAQFTLSPRAGDAGYALQIVDGNPSTRHFEWTANNGYIYANGREYAVGYYQLAQYDMTLALDSVRIPEPSTFLLAAVGSLGLAFCGWRRKLLR